jgi:hypothetical protein
MPELKTLPVAIQHVTVGDALRRLNGDGATDWDFVKTVKRGTKWVELRDSAGTLLRRAEVDTEVKVDRMVKTDEEKAAERNAFLAEQAEKMLVKMEGAYAEAEADIRKTFSENFVPNSSHLEALYSGVTLKGYAYRLREGLEHHAGEKTLVELFQMLADDIATRLVERDPRARWSGGFSFSNAIEQNTDDTDRKLLKAIRWNFTL